jgi:Molybdopterin-guanine dinucleotide biosynthesis protein
MQLIVEGPDGSGKTTLVERIEREYGLTRRPRAVSSEAKALRPIDDYVEEELAAGPGLRFYDRFALISSPMYIPLHATMPGRFNDRDWLLMVNELFWNHDPVIIVCLPPIEEVRKNVAGDDNNKVVWDKIDQYYLNYHAWVVSNIARRHKVTDQASIMVWDYTKPDEKKLQGHIRYAIAMAEVKGK